MKHRRWKPIRLVGRRGFSLIEASTVSLLMAVLALLLSATWSAFIRPTSDIAARCRVMQEASLALASLTRDLGGSHVDYRAGGKMSHRLVGRTQPDNSQLRLCYDSLENPNGIADWSAPDQVVSYFVEGGKLVRWDENSGATFVAARDLESMVVEDQGDGTVRIVLNFQYRHISKSYTVVARFA